MLKIKKIVPFIALKKKIFWVCPMIDSDEELKTSNVYQRNNILKKIFKKTAILHGKMSPDDKNIIIEKFKNGIVEHNRNQSYIGKSSNAPTINRNFCGKMQDVRIYNRALSSQEVKIFSATQKGIIEELDRISQMEDYSDLLAWDFHLSREGTGLKTQYSLRAVPRKKGTNPLIEATFAEQKEKGFDIKELMTGGNPFSPGE